MHARLKPLRHEFRYPVYFFSFDLDEFASIQNSSKIFSHNRPNIFSLYDRDYLDRKPGSIRQKLKRYLDEQNLGEDLGRVELITNARFLGHVFNPVSFFYCYTTTGELKVIVAQVSNTFDESHLYILDKPSTVDNQGLRHYRHPKTFHVSPFFERKGDYEFKMSEIGPEADISINLFQDHEAVLVSRLQGQSRALNFKTLLSTLIQFPLGVLLTLPRIHIQAAKLYFQKKLTFFTKPIPSSPMTIRAARPKFLERLCAKQVMRFLNRIERGLLNVTMPDGSQLSFGGKKTGITAQLKINHYRFFTRAVIGGGIGLGEGYMNEDWQSPDAAHFLKLLIQNKPYMEQNVGAFQILGNIANWILHLFRKNTVEGSSKNIHAHYDTGNKFFELFLDESMSYSSAFFETTNDTLTQAQKHKLTKIIRKARIGANHHVLEVGCGWGSFAIEAVRQTGCRVTGATISEEQFKYARQKVKEAGLENQIEIKMCDYRKLSGHYDRIVSIEMLEAVGHEYLGTYFHCLDNLLKPDGIAVVQVITIPDQRYESYRKRSDWIRKYIFPGGHLPSLTALSQAMTRSSSLLIDEIENIGPHYAKTLTKWRIRFQAQKESLKKLGCTPKDIRTWEYYFYFCEAAFATRYLNDLQIVLTREANESLITIGGSFIHDKTRTPVS